MHITTKQKKTKVKLDFEVSGLFQWFQFSQLLFYFGIKSQVKKCIVTICNKIMVLNKK